LTNLDPYCAYARVIRDDGRLTRPFYFNVQKPALVNQAQREQVLAKRSEYSQPREIATRDALDCLETLDHYGGSLLSSGVGGYKPSSRKAPTSAMAQAAKVLRGEGGELSSSGNQNLWNSLDNISGVAAEYLMEGLEDDGGDGDTSYLNERAIEENPIIPPINIMVDDDDAVVNTLAAELDDLFDFDGPEQDD